MSATTELLEQYKQVIHVQADRLAAEALGVKSQTVSNWRTRGSQAEPWLIETMCVKLGCDAAPWLIRALAEQATGAHNRKVWERLGKSFGRGTPGVATVALLLAAAAGAVIQCGSTVVVCLTSVVVYGQEGRGLEWVLFAGAS